MDISVVIDIASWALIIAGSVFLVIGGIGALRFPDFFTRQHAAGITDTGGAGFLIAGLLLQGGLSLVSVKLIFILLFFFFTSPTATHALAQAALSSGLKPKLHKTSGDQGDGEDASSKI